MTQRPQHLLCRAARSRRVFYWEEPIWHRDDSSFPGLSDGNSGLYLEVLKEGPSIWVMRPHLVEGLRSEASQRILLDRFIASYVLRSLTLWYYTPMALGFSAHLRPKLVVYDCMDELSAFLGASPLLAARESQLFDKTDVVFTGGYSLFEKKQLQHGNVHVLPSSVDASHFAAAKKAAIKGSEPGDQASIAHPRAGFYGVIDERFDLSLLASISQLRPMVQFIVIGPVVKIDPSTLPQAANIHYLHGKTYAELPSYLAGWDVALLPFAQNEATRYISPTKTPEYLAAGKPVVSTPVRDVVRTYGDARLVAIASTAEAFVKEIDRALQPPTVEWQEAVTRKLGENSWDSTWAAMEVELRSAQSSRVPVMPTGRPPIPCAVQVDTTSSAYILQHELS